MEVYIGKVKDTKGLKGELLIFFLTKSLYCQQGDDLFFENLQRNIKLGPYKVESVKKYKIKEQREFYLLKLNEINTIDQALLLKNCYIVKQYDVLPENVFLRSDLIRCRIIVENSTNCIGVVEDIVNVKPDYKLLLVKKLGSKEEIFIPFIKTVISKIDVKNKLIIVRQIDGIVTEI